MRPERVVMTGEEMARTIKRMAHEVIEMARGAKDLVLIGIQTRGVYLAQRLAEEIEKTEKVKVPIGILDITLYRDDLTTIARQPVVKETRIPFDITDKSIVLIDDVLFAGRTIRAALDAIIDFGRPRAIQLAVLIDRGHRELPIQADFTGKSVATSLKEEVLVKMEEVDDKDQVTLVEKEG